MDISLVVSIIFGIVNLILTVTVGYFGFVLKTNARLTKLETANEVFWKVVDPHLASIIHSPIHVERDALVDKLIANCITESELQELSMRLKAMISEESGDKQLAAILLLARVGTKLATGNLKAAREQEAKWYH